jgi:Zn-dependent peptidase ImmA (M78 family)/transcriptional regulator with XRE-family HTH domain
MNISLEPRILRWARERAGLDVSALAKKLGIKKVERVTEWETTGELPYEKAELLAQKTYTPFGFLFLKEPPEDKLPIPDFRTVGDSPVRRPSPDLLETVYQMQRRQAWMREFLLEEGEPALGFIGSATVQAHPDRVAQAMRTTLGCDEGWAAQERTWMDALMHLRQKIEEIGILIVINGVVGNNNRRKLAPDEFRGFALSDSYAPLVFINGADFKGAQMFTLAHELAHLWIGKDGVSNSDVLLSPTNAVEKWCNAVAAEFLVPSRELRAAWVEAQRADEPYQFLAVRFKVSSLVAARRALDLGLATRGEFFAFYEAYRQDERRRQQGKKSGGNFWATQNVRIGQRFGAAVVQSAREGRLLYREAYHLTGLYGPTFNRFAEKLGFQPR